MKKTILFILITASLFSCKKETSQPIKEEGKILVQVEQVNVDGSAFQSDVFVAN